jgi:hypothetical protein
MSDSSTGGGIPANERWNGPIYTTGGDSVKLDNMAFAIVRVEYNPDAGTTGLDTTQIKVTNNMGASNGARPGTVIYDYMTNTRYGCAIPSSQIDDVNTPGTSLYNLNTYSNQTIQYIDTSGNPQTQLFRYRINGAVNTAASCLTNLQTMVDSCDSWLQYSEATGKWRVVINGPYSGLESDLFLVDSNNIIGGVQINPVDLNETYNQVEVAYPNKNIKDQTDYQVIDLTNPANWSSQVYDDILSPNEAVNRLNISLPLVNEAVQAKYLAARRLLQSREDLVISCELDYSGIQIEAGDVIRVGQPDYGWGPTTVDPVNPYKLFRVSSVNEQTLEDGSLVASIEAFEYNGTVYADNAITDFVPADNTGLTDPNVISEPCPPTITSFTDANATVTGFEVTSCVPDTGTVLYMDFNYGNNSNVQTHNLYRTVQSAGGIPFTNSDSANAIYNNVTITVNDLPSANYYWSATARNDTSGRYSNVSNIFAWGGANIQPYNPISNTGGIAGGQVKSNTITGTNIQTNTIVNNNIVNNTIEGGKIALGTVAGNNIANGTISIQNMQGGFQQEKTNENFDIRGTYPFVDVTTGTFNVPVYLDGTTVAANEYFPYYQNTATTAMGYAQNSTAPWLPQQAGLFNMDNGDYDWWIIGAATFSPSAVNIKRAGTFKLVANAATTVQIGSGRTSANFEIVAGTYFSTIELEADKPVFFYDEQVAVGATTSQIVYFMRNMVSGTRVYVFSGTTTGYEVSI